MPIMKSKFVIDS